MPVIHRALSPERFDVSVSGRAVRVRTERPYLVSDRLANRPPRGPIKTFSDGARSRMVLAANRLPVGSPHLLVTLTYPAVFPTDVLVIKAHRAAFYKRLQRAYPGVVVLWKLEFQRRGAVHYHLIVANCRSKVAEVQDFVSLAWYQVVGSGDERHFRAGTQVEVLRSSVAYLASYLKKVGASKSYQDEAPEWAHGLKRWGMFGASWDIVATGVDQVVEALEALAVRAVGWWGWSPGLLLSMVEPPREALICWYPLDS